MPTNNILEVISGNITGSSCEFSNAKSVTAFFWPVQKRAKRKKRNRIFRSGRQVIYYD